MLGPCGLPATQNGVLSNNVYITKFVGYGRRSTQFRAFHMAILVKQGGVCLGLAIDLPQIIVHPCRNPYFTAGGGSAPSCVRCRQALFSILMTRPRSATENMVDTCSSDRNYYVLMRSYIDRASPPTATATPLRLWRSPASIYSARHTL